MLTAKQKGKSNLLKVILGVFGVVVVDWSTKYLVVVSGLPYSVNSGGAFSVFSGNGWFLGLSIIIFLGLVGCFANNRQRGYQLMVGGALANLIDRIYRGGVVDFINIWIFPSFNLADVTIVGGLIMVVVWPMIRPPVVQSR